MEEWEEESNVVFPPSLLYSHANDMVDTLIQPSILPSQEEACIEPTSSYQTHPLSITWNLYHHASEDKNWNQSSYVPILQHIDTMEQLLALCDGCTDRFIKYSMLFLFRQGISPLWEDVQNRHGGAFSYKVLNKHVPEVWRQLMYLVVGETITINPEHMKLVNGITISPKKQFCIIKIWFRDCSVQDPSAIRSIPSMMKNGSLFRKHEPEF